MRNFLLIVYLILIQNIIFANGVAVVNSTNGTYLTLVSSSIEVKVENQVALVKSIQSFRNELSSASKFKYSFPMPEGANATLLKWYVDGKWHQAGIAAAPQDTTLPGPNPNETYPPLKEYLGKSPLYFDIADKVTPGNLVIVELTYVEFLDYEFGNVFFSYPNDYQLIQSKELSVQKLNFEVKSERAINSIEILSHNNAVVHNDGSLASIIQEEFSAQAAKDYKIEYSLSLYELGLFSFSSLFNEDEIPDTRGNGFFSFVVEPDPSDNQNVINKVFSLIVDCSGSMSGEKIIEARNAAKFIINNLNEGDKFNVIQFDTDVKSFKNEHVAFNEENRSAALSYVSGLYAGGSTNISGSFETAIPQFSSADGETANIIIFFTDGEATVGETSTEGILNIVESLNNNNETEISIFTFGIGSNVNEQLLTRLAQQNNGISSFLKNNELESAISEFYLKIRNPVLLSTQITFEPNILTEIYPKHLPNLYKGQQLIVTGRYKEAKPVELTLSGTAFGQSVEYNYNLDLADSTNYNYQFLTKIWAKQKIEDLLVEYNSLNPNLTEADSLKNIIIKLSLDYGIITEFTSFSGEVTGIEEGNEDLTEHELPTDFKIIGNYPNPFNPSTTIRFSVGNIINGIAKIRIYNSIGELVRELFVTINGNGIYEVKWNGLLENGQPASSDVYIYVIELNNVLLSNKMVLLK